MIGINNRFFRSNFLCRAYTLFIVICCWVVFRSNGIGDAIAYLMSMFGLSSNAILDSAFFELLRQGAITVTVAIILCTPIYKHVLESVKKYNDELEELIRSITVIALFCLSIVMVITSTYNPFIYFNF